MDKRLEENIKNKVSGFKIVREAFSKSSSVYKLAICRHYCNEYHSERWAIQKTDRFEICNERIRSQPCA